MPATIPVLLQFISYALIMKQSFEMIAGGDPSDTGEDDPGRLVNSRSLDAILPLLYGKTRIGGNQVFFTTTGTDNSKLHMITTLSEGQVNGIVEVDGVPQIFLNDKLYTESDYVGLFTYEFFDGSPTQSGCETLHTAYPDWDEPLRYTSYIYYRLNYDRDKFLSVPKVTVILEGLKVKNFETEDDYDSMPMLYTDNLAYCVYDLLTRSSVRGGKGIDPTRIDLTSFRDAAVYYDTYGFTCNMPINKDQSVEDNLASMLVNGRSSIIYSNSKFKLKFRDTREEAVCMQITDADIIQSGKESTLEITPSSSLFSRPNAIKAKFISAEKNYHDDEKVFTDDDALAAEGDYRELDISLLGLSTLETVIPMSYYYLERARYGNNVKLTIGNKGIVLEPMDLVEITATMPGWSETAKPLYRVTNVQIHEDGNVSLALIQEDDAFYNDDYDIDPEDLFITNLLSPSDEAQSVINVTHEEEVYYYRGKSFTRWKIYFDPPSVSDYPFWDYAEIWIKIGDGGWKFMTTATSDYQLDPVEEGVTYYAKIRSVSTFGTKEDFNICVLISQHILGQTGLPADMTFLNITAVNDTIFITGDEVVGPDIVGYEFRIAAQTISTWVGAIYLGFNRKPTWSLSGIRAGVYRIFCCAMNDANLYSANAVYADFLVEDPKGYTVYHEEDFDYPEGSHNNTEYYEVAANDYCIRVTHNGSLEGTWTSPVVDVGETRHLRVQGDFILKVVDSSATWEALWPTPNTWDSLAIDDTWYKLFGTNAASRVEAKLKYGVSSVSENSIDKFELMSVDTIARYYQLEVKLIDPDEDQYVLLDGSGANTVLTLMFMR